MWKRLTAAVHFSELTHEFCVLFVDSVVEVARKQFLYYCHGAHPLPHHRSSRAAHDRFSVPPRMPDATCHLW